MSNGAIDATNLTRERANDIKHRKRLSTLSTDEIDTLRDGFRAMQGIADDRGYGHYGSIHGKGNPMFCQHGNQLFLPWHRAYLYFMEQHLQDVAPGLTLPWWDYPAFGTAIPGPYAEPETADGERNPLYDAEIVAADGIRDPSWDERTYRMPDETHTLATEQDIAALAGHNTFDAFSGALEQLHNTVHRFVGGSMVDPRFAAWDPIFWAHHCMIDRLWALWQNDHPGARPRDEHLDRGLSFFDDMTVRETLNITDLGYDYAATEVLGEAEGPAEPTAPRSFDVAPLDTAHVSAEIELHGVDQAVPTFEGRIFAGNIDADAETPKERDLGFLGAFTVFGKLDCWGEEGHCEEPAHRRKYDRRRVPVRYAKARVPIPDGFVDEHAEDGRLRLKVVPVLGNNRDYEGRDPADALRYERISIVTYAAPVG